ncbi:MAG: sulfurtransferase TusA family protein [Spirochaetia bacterium]|nr:sulfurtransferase TusA family protein [Spirochaetia bacterium]
MDDFQIKKIVDCRGKNCPIPLTRLKKALENINSGDTVHMISTFPESVDHMVIWSRKTGNELLKTEAKGGEYHFFVMKK